MASLLFVIGGGLVNALDFSGTNFLFSRFTDHGVKKRKRHDLVEEKPKKAWDEWNKERMTQFDFINKRSREKIRQGYTSATLMKQCLNTNEYLQNI